MSVLLDAEVFGTVMERHRERQLTGPTHCGPMCEADILRLAARAAAPSADDAKYGPIDNRPWDLAVSGPLTVKEVTQAWRSAGRTTNGTSDFLPELTREINAARAAAPSVEPENKNRMWRQCVCGAWYWGAEQSDSDRSFSRASPEPTPGLRETQAAISERILGLSVEEGRDAASWLAAIHAAAYEAAQPLGASPAPEPSDSVTMTNAELTALLAATRQEGIQYARTLARSAPEPTGLDAAWAEAEAALPQGWGIGVHRLHGRSGWVYAVGASSDETWEVEAKADTLPAALRTLAARLRESK